MRNTQLKMIHSLLIVIVSSIFISGVLPETDLRHSQVGSSKLEEVFRWKQIYFDGIESIEGTGFQFPTDLDGDEQQQQTFIPSSNVPMGMDHYNGRLFITVPRRQEGVPSTLNYVDLTSRTKNKSPRLRPYPDLETNTIPVSPDPNRIISVYRTRIDDCNRLWFLDTGMLEYPDNQQQIQRPAIWVVDPENGQTIRRFEIPIDVVEEANGVVSITVDVDRDNCNAAFAYMPDYLNGRIYVYSFSEDRIWTFSHNYFHRSPLEGDFNVGGVKYQWEDAIFSITLAPKESNGYRMVFFHPLSSTNEFVVSSRVLQNSTAATRVYHGNDFSLYGSRGPFTQSSMHQYDPLNGVMLYAEVARNAVGCWNTKYPFNAENHGVIARDDEKMIYPSDLKVDSNGVLWVFTNSLPITIYSSLNINEFNFRVWRANVRDAIQGSVCQDNS